MPTDFGKKDPQSSTDTTDYKKFYFMDQTNPGKCIDTCGRTDQITTWSRIVKAQENISGTITEFLKCQPTHCDATKYRSQVKLSTLVSSVASGSPEDIDVWQCVDSCPSSERYYQWSSTTDNLHNEKVCMASCPAGHYYDTFATDGSDTVEVFCRPTACHSGRPYNVISRICTDSCIFNAVALNNIADHNFSGFSLATE